MSGIAPKKRFSQNFLTDPGTADRIVAALDIQPDTVVLEIGPGTGMLTKRLVASQARRVIAIDLDPRAIEHLRQQPWATTSRLDVRHGDALRANLGELFAGVERTSCVIIGNIPYAITADLLFMVFEARLLAHRAVIMMQREVAKRCVATVGSKDYGVLALATWLASDAKQQFTVSPGSFFPKPDVTSAVVRFDLRATDVVDVAMGEAMRFVRAAFSQRRKVLVNALDTWCRTVCGEPARSIAERNPALELGRRRAEELTGPQLIGLMQDIRKASGGRHG